MLSVSNWSTMIIQIYGHTINFFYAQSKKTLWCDFGKDVLFFSSRLEDKSFPQCIVQSWVNYQDLIKTVIWSTIPSQQKEPRWIALQANQSHATVLDYEPNKWETGCKHRVMGGQRSRLFWLPVSGSTPGHLQCRHFKV